MVKRKKVAFEEFLENRNGERWENYKGKCKKIKRGLRQEKEGQRKDGGVEWKSMRGRVIKCFGGK